MGLPENLLPLDPSTCITPDAFAINGKVVMLNANAKIDRGVANLTRVSLSMRIEWFPNR